MKGRQTVNFDPQKFFVGLIDFFSILLPGAVLTWMLMGDVGPSVLGEQQYKNLNGAQAAAAFLFASYLSGHLVFLGASWLDLFYDWMRRHTLDKQIRLLALRDRLVPRYVRIPVWLVFGRERGIAVDRAGKIKRQSLHGVGGADAINTFQWSKAWLTAESPASLAVVQRFEADSKFFRCFALVLALLLLFWPLHHRWPAEDLWIVVVLLLLALWRYMEQRFKATNQAYWSVITLSKGESKRAPESAGAVVTDHAAGVVFRVRGGTREFLLADAPDATGNRELPGGRAEEGEQLREAAVRTVLNETGVWASIARDLGERTCIIGGKEVRARLFLMRALSNGIKGNKEREPKWLSLQAASGEKVEATRHLLEAMDAAARGVPATNHPA